MRVLILTAGALDKWGGDDKHMLDVWGEPLVHRTIRLLARAGVEDIRVVTPEERMNHVVQPAVRMQPSFWRTARRFWTQEWDGSRPYWAPDDTTLVLYGDIYFSEALIGAMVACDPPAGWCVFGRAWGSDNTGKPHGEMWGWVISPEAHDHLDAARAVAISYYDNGLWNRCLGWEVYRIAVKHLPWDHRPEPPHFIEWDDETEDFDTPDEYDLWRTLR